MLTPVVVPAHTTVDSFVVGPERYGVPTVYAMAGTEHATGERVEIVSFEWPEEYQPLLGAAANKKRLNEERQIGRLRADFKAGGLADPFAKVAAGRDPPDFSCETDGGSTIGVEITQLTLGDRAEDHQLLSRVKGRILGVEARFPGRFHRLQQHVVAASFHDTDYRTTKPARAGEAQPLISALQEFRPDLSAPPATMPDRADPRDTLGFAGGSISAARLSGHPTTTFFRVMQFELVLASSTVIRHSDAWDQFTGRLADHDQDGVDLLVVVAGSPTTVGVAHPVDTMLARAVVARAEEQVVEATHVRRIWIHAWPERAVYEVIPGQRGARRLCGTPLRVQPVPKTSDAG